MSKETAKKELALLEKALSLDQMVERAKLLVNSKLLPAAIKTPEAALAIMMMGAEYGIPPMKSFQSIHVISGKPCLSAQLMLALCQATGELERFEVKPLADKDGKAVACMVSMTRRGRKPYTYTFGDEQAREMKAKEYDSAGNAKVVSLIDKYNYRTMKATMYEWRAISHACRIVFPDAVLGLYTTDEVEDVITHAEEERIDGKAEMAATVEEKKEALGASLEASGNSVHAHAEQAELMMTLCSYYLRDPKFSTSYPDRNIGEIFDDKTPGGIPKGKQFLERVAASSSDPEDRATVGKFLQMMEKEPA